MSRRHSIRLNLLLRILVTLSLLGNLLAQTGSRGVVDKDSKPAVATLQPGPYYALVIGNNNYRYLPKLQTAVDDAKGIAQLLKDRYGFTTTALYDASRDDILTALVNYRRTLSGNSNLLIYYAGHGHNDRDADEAYWLPVDAQKDNNQNWISADDITRDVRTISSQHILIISDSCYSGVLTRGADAAINPAERGAFLAKMWSSKSRTLMASGGDEPVADGGGGGHSVFANALLQSLQSMADTAFTAAALFQRVQPRVAGRSEQLPQYNLIRNSGHDFGDFIFSRNGEAFAAPVILPPIRGDLLPPSGGDAAPPAIVSVSDTDAIKKVLDLYQQAYNYRDSSILWKIWPAAPVKTRLAIENAFKSAASIKMTINVEGPVIAGDGQSATVRGQLSQVFTPRSGSAQPSRNADVRFALQHSAAGWIIVEVR